MVIGLSHLSHVSHFSGTDWGVPVEDGSEVGQPISANSALGLVARLGRPDIEGPQQGDQSVRRYTLAPSHIDPPRVRQAV